jgi:sporulation protein YlmC with PRC-barrel domain
MTDTGEITGTGGAGTGAGTGITDTTTLTDTEEITGTDTLTDTATLAPVRGVIRASELLDYNVENAQNEDLGSVEDALVSLQDSCINYLVLSFGGVLGLGDNQYLVPWRAVGIQPQQERLLLNIDPEALNDAPTFDVNNLPDMTAPDWDTDLTIYWENIDIIPSDTEAAQTGTTTGMTDTITGTNAMTDTMAGDASMTGVPCGMAAMSDTTSPAAGAGSAITDTNATTGTIEVQPLLAMRLSELLDYNVRNPEGEDLGAIEDIMVDWRQDRLAYAILSFGGFLGLGDKWFILPLDALA